MKNQQHRYEDYGDGTLHISEKDGCIEIYTVPANGRLIFANHAWAGQSPHTFKLLQLALIKALKMDNEEIPLPNCIQTSSSESRPGDNYLNQSWKWGHIVVWDHWEIGISIFRDEDDEPVTFYPPEKWWKSKHTYEIVKQLINTMRVDNEEIPQKYRK